MTARCALLFTLLHACADLGLVDRELLGDEEVDCSDEHTLCVDDTDSEFAEYATIQAAVDNVAPGQSIVVFAGSYEGFRVDDGGSEEMPITISARDGARIERGAPSGNAVEIASAGFVTIQGFKIVGVPNHGISVQNATSDGCVLRNNHIEGNAASGIFADGDVAYGGDGIITELLVEQNVVIDNGEFGIALDGVQDAIIQNNLIAGNSNEGIRAYQIDGGGGPRDLTVANNTILVQTVFSWCLRITEDEGGNLAFNNILLSDDPSGGSIALDSTNGFASATNIVSDRFTPDRDATILSLSEWQALGYDTGSVIATADELFVSPEDYHLAEDAPAVDRGVQSLDRAAAPDNDLEATPRAQGEGLDIGAFELCVSNCEAAKEPGGCAAAPSILPWLGLLVAIHRRHRR